MRLMRPVLEDLFELVECIQESLGHDDIYKLYNIEVDWEAVAKTIEEAEPKDLNLIKTAFEKEAILQLLTTSEEKLRSQKSGISSESQKNLETIRSFFET